MSDTPTFNQQMVTKLQNLLLANPLASTITIDGTIVTFADATARLNWFLNQVAREQGTRQTFTAISLGGFSP